MRNNQSNKPLTGPKSKIDIKQEHTQTIFKNIKDISTKMWENYNDHDFCKQLAIAQENTLQQFTLTQLKDTYKTINKKPTTTQEKQFKAFLTYNPREQEQFIVNKLKVKLVNRFQQKTVPMTETGELEYQGTPIQYYNYNNIQKYLKKQTGGNNTLQFIEDELKKRKEALKRFNKKNNKNNKNTNENIRFNTNKIIAQNLNQVDKNNTNIRKKLDENIILNKHEIKNKNKQKRNQNKPKRNQNKPENKPKRNQNKHKRNKNKQERK